MSRVMPDEIRESDTLRDTVPIRPLRRWASRLLVTLAILASAALGIYAAMKMTSMASDPAAAERFEAMERLRLGGANVDSASVDTTRAAADTTTAP